MEEVDPAVDQPSPRAGGALAVADAFLSVPPQSAATDVRQLFTPEELVELGCALALFIGLSKVLIVLGLEPTEMQTTSSPMPGSA